MKQFLTFCLTAVILITGVASMSASGSEASGAAVSNTKNLQNSSNPRKACFNACTILSTAGIMNEQIRLSHSVQTVSSRALYSLFNFLRIQHRTQITHQNFYTGNILFLHKSAEKKRNGYYLYYLCKILI